MDTNNSEMRHLVLSVQETIRDYDQQIKKNPKSSQLFSKRSYALMRLADAYIKMEGEEELAEKTMLKALDDCEELLKLDPQNYDAYVNSGLLKEKLSNIKSDDEDLEGARLLLKEAIRSHTKAINIEKHTASIYCIRGNVRQSLAHMERKQGKFTSAEKLSLDGIVDYNHAIKLGYSSAYASRAAAKVLLALSKKNHDKKHDQAISLLREAINDYNNAIDNHVDKPKLFYLRAEAKGILAEVTHKIDRASNCSNLVDSAIADYKHELKQDPQFFYAFLGIASSKYICADSEFYRKNYDQALAFIKEGKAAATQAVKLHSTCVSAYYERAYLSFLEAAIAEKREDTAKARALLKATVKDWHKIIKFEPDNDNFKQRLESAEEALEGLSGKGISGSVSLDELQSEGTKMKH